LFAAARSTAVGVSQTRMPAARANQTELARANQKFPFFPNSRNIYNIRQLKQTIKETMKIQIKKSALITLFIAAILIFALLLSPIQEKKIAFAPGESNFIFTRDGNFSIKSVATIGDESLNFNILYADDATNQFTIIGKSPSERLATSAIQNLTVIEKDKTGEYYHKYFIASYNDSSNSESYLLKAQVLVSGGMNITSIQEITNAPGAPQVCGLTEAAGSNTCRIGSVNFNVTDINYTSGGEALISITAGPNTNFNTVFDGEGNYFRIPQESILPTAVPINIVVYNALNEPIEAYSFTYNGTQTKVTDITCLPNWTAYQTPCNSTTEKSTTYYKDTNKCGLNSLTPVNVTGYCDYGNNKRIGTPNKIQESNFDEAGENFEVFIDGDEEEDWVNDYEEETVEIYYDDELITEFGWDFEDEPLNFYEIKFQRQSSTKKYGYLIVEGIDAEKTIYVNKKNSTSSLICVEDSESTDSENDISNDCDQGSEEIVSCPGSEGDIDCEIEGSYFKVSGLDHSGVKEFLGSAPAITYCTPIWTYGAWSACDATGHQTRTATDARSCGTTTGRQAITQTCTYVAPQVCTPSWTYSEWTPEECPKNGKQTRTATDTMNCGTTAGRQSLMQDCESETSSTMMILVVIIILVVILIGAIIALLILRKKGSSEPNVTVLTRPSPPPKFSPPGQMNRPSPPPAMPGQISRPMSLIQPYRRI